MFTGFPADALAFYADIARHNDRDWFEANRERFMTQVVAPAQAFITTLGPRLAELSPGTGFDPNHTGRGSFKKIHTDQRFQQGREPFKTSCQIIFWNGPLPQKKANSVYFVQFDAEEVVLAAGLKYFDGKLVKTFRDAAVDATQGKQLTAAVEAVQAAGYTIEGEHYKGVPKGYPEDHPNAALLKHDALYARLAAPVPADIQRADFVDWCVGHFRRMEPVFAWSVDFLHRAVG
ncbi:MAG: DUF2461 domain-containing protein [Myxococcales bacterium]|nr:DUF2461 domain-containing protein [Myxococcales bacterium]